MLLLSLALSPSKHLFGSASLCNGMCKLCMAMSENIEGMPVQARCVDPWLLEGTCTMCDVTRRPDDYQTLCRQDEATGLQKVCPGYYALLGN